jgi:hypothetical protein
VSKLSVAADGVEKIADACIDPGGKMDTWAEEAYASFMKAGGVADGEDGEDGT